jgi:hypothetical protein
VIPAKIAADRKYYRRMVVPVEAALERIGAHLVSGVDLCAITGAADEVAAYVREPPHKVACRSCGFSTDDVGWWRGDDESDDEEYGCPECGAGGRGDLYDECVCE